MPQVVTLEMIQPPYRNYSYLVIDPSGEYAVVIDLVRKKSKIDQP